MLLHWLLPHLGIIIGCCFLLLSRLLWMLLLLELLLGRIACGTRSFPFQFVLALGVMIHIRLGAKFSGAEGAGVQLDAGVCGKVFLREREREGAALNEALFM